MTGPKAILVFSGKRKSGKDYMADLLLERFGCELCQILRLSGPLKEQYARENGLDFQELLNSSSYKEIHRGKMIKWGEDKRNADPYFFCNNTVQMTDPSKLLWIISDARRMTDVKYFREEYPHVAKFVRITAPIDVRTERGFVFAAGIDDAESECALDSGVTWDFEICNDGNDEILNHSIQMIVDCVNNMLQR